MHHGSVNHSSKSTQSNGFLLLFGMFIGILSYWVMFHNPYCENSIGLSIFSVSYNPKFHSSSFPLPSKYLSSSTKQKLRKSHASCRNYGEFVQLETQKSNFLLVLLVLEYTFCIFFRKKVNAFRINCMATSCVIWEAKTKTICEINIFMPLQRKDKSFHQVIFKQLAYNYSSHFILLLVCIVEFCIQ